MNTGPATLLARPPPDGVKRMLPWLVAVAFFMEALDATILNTAVPAIAAALGVTPLSMKAVLSSYTLALAMFVPVSGWLTALARGACSPPPSRFSRWARCCAACRPTSTCWWPAALCKAWAGR